MRFPLSDNPQCGHIEGEAASTADQGTGMK